MLDRAYNRAMQRHLKILQKVPSLSQQIAESLIVAAFDHGNGSLATLCLCEHCRCLQRSQSSSHGPYSLPACRSSMYHYDAACHHGCYQVNADSTCHTKSSLFDVAGIPNGTRKALLIRNRSHTSVHCANCHSDERDAAIPSYCLFFFCSYN